MCCLLYQPVLVGSNSEKYVKYWMPSSFIKGHQVPVLLYGMAEMNRNKSWDKELCQVINSLAPGRSGSNLKRVTISERMLPGYGFMGTSCEIALRWMPRDTFGDKSTLAQVMAWCRQAPSHYQSQCCPRSMSPYGATRSQSRITMDQVVQRLYFHRALNGISWNTSSVRIV